MLKIKDNVNLKELERYGFQILKNSFYIAKLQIADTFYEDVKILIDNQRELNIVCDLQFYNQDKSQVELYDRLYDLVKADLVEKAVD